MMRFMVYRSSQGAVAKDSPCKGAVRGPEAAAWPGDFPWFIDFGSLDDLVRFMEENGGGIGLFTPEEGEEFPAIEIIDDEECEG